jgi:geranylgeranyl diphosphate synthase type II
MRHTMFPAGKRLRPLLAIAGAVATGGDPRRALVPAAGIECLHTYSLVHDDLPCMDDDDLRRGRPTCHKVFGEALAVLAGDALLTLAFEACAHGGADAVAALARAAGSAGMVGGQAEDVLAERHGGARTLAHVQWIHDHKTGALIAGALEVGALAGGGARADLPSLVAFGRHLGRAFQIADDCLDLTASPDTLGKNTGQDAAAGKLTYPAVLGLEQSLAAARAEADAAVALVREAARGAGSGPALDYAIGLLQDVARLSIERRS